MPPMHHSRTWSLDMSHAPLSCLMARDPYKYKELVRDTQDIRVLTLLPGAPRDPIQIQVHRVTLPTNSWDAPPYEALSYVWGAASEDDEARVTVVGNGDEPPTYIKITQNLHAALPYLRYRRHPRTLWIDTICIDQSNLVEKGHAVQRMAEVYNYAARVIIWLGPEAHNTTPAIKSLRWIGSQVIVNWKTRSMIMSSEATQDEIDDIILRDMGIFGVLLESPWFERLWVQQEAKLAQNAQAVCGATTIDWQTLRNALFCMWHLSQRKALPGDIVSQVNRFYILIAKTSFLLNELIFHGKSLKCSDSRDRVYALLGLIGGPERSLRIEPDYTLTTPQVYQDVVASYLKCLKRIDPIACCEASGENETMSSAPSWVPDWDKSRRSNYFHMKRHSPTFEAQAEIIDGRILKARGITVAKVKKATPLSLKTQSVSQDIVDQILEIAPRELWDNSPDREDIINAFCRTMIADHFRERWNPPDAQETIESEARVLIRAILDGSYSEEEHLATIPTATRYLGLVRLYAIERAFLVTEDGRFALGPRRAQPGDSIVVLLGCKSPLVFRPVTSGEYKHEGECYLDSAVAGQTLLGPLPEHFVNVTSYDAEEDTFVDSFLNRSTGKFQREEPRLVGKLGEGYRANYPTMEARREAENIAACEILAEREVKLEEFRII